MVRSPLTYASAALFCATLFFSCTNDPEPLPQPVQSSSSDPDPDQSSSSSVTTPEYSSSSLQGGQSSSNVTPEYSSSSPQQGGQSSSLVTTQSSSQGVQSSSSNAAPEYSSSSIKQPPIVSSSSSKAQPATGCGERNQRNPIAGFTCGWNITGLLTPGTILKPAEYTLPSGCTSVDWKYAPDTASMVLANECLLINESGIEALGSKNYALFAELTCYDGKHTTACNPKDGWASKIAPELTGACNWAKNPTTTARGGMPSGVAVKDPDKVCTSPTVVYKYDGGAKTWPSSGILNEWATWDKSQKETYNVEATLNCPAYPALVTSPCPPLEVKAGTDYLIECNGDIMSMNCGNKNTVTLKLDECVEINVMGYTDQYNLPTVMMRCEIQGTQNSVSVTLSLNGKTQSFTGSWGWLSEIILGKLSLGDNEFGTLCVTALSGATGVRCTGPSQ